MRVIPITGSLIVYTYNFRSPNILNSNILLSWYEFPIAPACLFWPRSTMPVLKCNFIRELLRHLEPKAALEPATTRVSSDNES
jgi:hypothetical protein